MDASAVIAAVSAVAAVAAVLVQYLLLAKPLITVENVWVDSITKNAHLEVFNRGNAIAYDVRITTMKGVPFRMWTPAAQLQVAESRTQETPRDQLTYVWVTWRQPPFMFWRRHKRIKVTPKEWYLESPYFNEEDGSLSFGKMWLPIERPPLTYEDSLGPWQYEKWMEYQRKQAAAFESDQLRLTSRNADILKDTERLRAERLAREDEQALDS